MNSISIFRKISVKVIVTEEFRKRVLEEIDLAISDIDHNLKLIESEHNKAKLSSNADQNFLNSLLMQADKLLANKNGFQQKRQEVENLKLEDEYPYTVVEGPVEIELGDKLFEKVNSEIIVKDGEVVEIRGIK